MEEISYIDRVGIGFLSFGKLHHDLGVAKVPDGAPVGSYGMSHVAFRFEGGLDDLKALYERVEKAGGRMDKPHDFGFEKGFYFYDPDGNRCEVYFDTLSEADGKEMLRTSTGARAREFDF